MSLKVMKQLGLQTTRPYGNICGIDSRKVKVYGLIEDVEVYIRDFRHISLVIPILWITKEVTSRGPQVADMECRETT
jgi:hypothetical protein